MTDDTSTPVSNDYQAPLHFTGKLDKLTSRSTGRNFPADIKKLKEAQRNTG
jgi:hypothetical protein